MASTDTSKGATMTDAQIQRLGQLNKVISETGIDSLLPAERAEFNDLVDQLREDIKQQSKSGKASNNEPKPSRFKFSEYVAKLRRHTL